mmetsp:Transcript_2915/g.6802  ORF Transcript_2915/g.6802 Transcript_2915/m.6802 type:complete len:368 (+) Transcript_2915:61-1164(+)
MLAITRWRGAASALSRCRAFHNSAVASVSVEGELREITPTSRVKRQVHHADVPFPNFLKTPKTCAVIGAPMVHGQSKDGTDEGPQMLRAAGLHKELKDLNWAVNDVGDLKFAPPKPDDPAMDEKERGAMRFGYAVGNGCKQVSELVHKHASEGEFVLTLGGDHSIGAGTVSGVLKARPNTGVVWVDAHADINTPTMSESGNIHGMPVAFLMKLIKPSKVPGWEWMDQTPTLHPQQLVYIGLRDVDEAERFILKELGITCYTMFHVDKYGIGGVMERTLEQLHGRPLHCSYDIDGVDPVHAPSTGTTVRGGLTFREAHYLVESISETGRLGSLDMVEVNPELGSKVENMQTVEMGLALIDSAMGSRIL